MSIEIITTVAGSAVFFLLFTVSLGFWGRLLLRALGIKEENGYGSPLPLVATIATLALVLRYVFYLTHNFDLLFSLIFILGLLGFVVELLLYLLKGLKPDIEKHSLVSSFTEKHSLILTGFAVCVVCSAYMCLIWPSRTMEPWLSNHMDFYYWIFSSDYWRGLADATIGSKYGYQNWPFDSFGAFILFGFFASAKGGQTFMAAPYFLVTLLSWIGICAYSIIRSVFRLPRIVALLLALGLVGGNFFNYIILKGYFGHIVGLVGFLTCLTVVFSATSTKGIKESAFVLFFPILYLFVCYQAVFVVFVSMVFLALFLVECLSLQLVVKETLAAIPAALKRAILKIIFPIVAAFILLPQVTILTFNRTFSAAAQLTGPHLGLIDPAFFCGIPLYNDDIRLGIVNASFIWYIAFIAAILILAMYVCCKDNTNVSEESKGKAKAIVLLFLACIFVYLFYFCVKGDFYVVWKYSAYSVLPLSFVFASLLLAAVLRLAKGRMRTFSIVTAVIAVILLIMPIIAVNSRFYGPLGKATDNVSLIPFASAISKANYQDRDKSKVFFDFFHSQMDGAAALISIPSKKEVFLMDGMYFFKKVDDYFRYFDENSVIYTDKLFPLMYNSSYENLSLMSFQRYDFQRLNAVGAVAYTGLKAYSTLADASEVKVKVLVPMNLRGQDLRLGVLLPTGGKPVPSLCRGVSAAFSDGRPLPESSFRGDQYVALIPKEEQREAFIEFTVSLPGDFPAETSPKGNDTGTTHCGFEFAGIGLNTLQ